MYLLKLLTFLTFKLEPLLVFLVKGGVGSGLNVLCRGNLFFLFFGEGVSN